MPLSAASTPPARSGRELSGTFLQPMEVEKINSCGRVALICAFSRGPSVSEVRDWIMRAERRCSRAHRIESSKVARLVWWSSCKKRTNPTFHCCVQNARVSHTIPGHKQSEKRMPEKCASSDRSQRQKFRGNRHHRQQKAREIWPTPCQRCCTSQQSNTEWRSGVNVSIFRHVIQMLSAIFFDKNATTRLNLSLQRRISETLPPRKRQCSHMRLAMHIPPQLTAWGPCVEKPTRHLIKSPQKRSARNEHVCKEDFKEHVFAFRECVGFLCPYLWWTMLVMTRCRLLSQ